MMYQVDRPTHHSLVFLKKVEGYSLVRHPQLRDEFVEDVLRDLYGQDTLNNFFTYMRSSYTMEGHYANLWLYDRPHTKRVKDPDYNKALCKTADAFRLPSPIPSIRWERLETVPFISTSGAGWTYEGKKGEGDNHEIAIKRAVNSLYSWREGQKNWRYTPDVVVTGTELGSFDRPKIRNVWGKSFHNIILEGVNAFPLINEYQNWADSPMIPAMHLYKVLPIIIRDILQDEDSPSTGICVDIESFDATPQKWMIYDAFDILKENITFSDVEGEHCWNYSREFFVETPVIMPNGLMWLKTLGIPSGSYFTQLIGSIINHILITYIQLKIWTRPFKLKVLGDDSAFGLPYKLGWPDLKKISAVATELGFKICPDKAIVAQRPEEMEFLGHVVRGLRIHRDVGKLLRLALFPEYTVSSSDMSVARVEGLLIESGMTSWSIINLLKCMRVKFNSKGGKKFVMEDKNWLEINLPTKIIPTYVDLVKAWTLT